MVWVERDLIDHVVPTPLPWARTPSTRPGCSKPHPTWPWFAGHLRQIYKFANRNLLTMVQATWILILPAPVHFYAFLGLSGSGTVRYIRNVAKKRFGVFFPRNSY